MKKKTSGNSRKFLVTQGRFFDSKSATLYLHTQYICISAWGVAAEFYLKQIVSMKKRKVWYVCRVPALAQTNPLFVKAGLLKLNEVFKLQICKLMQNSMTGFNVEHKSFTLAGSLHSYNTRFSKKIKFHNWKTNKTWPTFFRYLGPRFWSGILEF